MSKVSERPKAPADPTSGAAAKPKLLDEVRARVRRLNCSIRAEDTYVDWVRRVRDATLGTVGTGGGVSAGFSPRLDGGRGGIRTHGWSPIDGFQDRCIQPLCHPSCMISRARYRQSPGTTPSGAAIIPSATSRTRCASALCRSVRHHSARDQVPLQIHGIVFENPLAVGQQQLVALVRVALP